MKRHGLIFILVSVIAAAGLLSGCSSSTELAASYAKAASIHYSSENRADSEPAAASSAPQAVSEVSGVVSRAESISSGTEAAAGESSVPVLTGVMTATDGIGRISVPDGWTDLNGQIEDTLGSFSIKAGCQDEAMYLMFTSDSIAGSGVPDLQSYFDTIVTGVTESSQLSDVNRQADEDVTLSAGGYPAKVARFTADYTQTGSDSAGEPLAFWIYAVQAGDYYCQFECWTRAADSVSAGQVFDAIVNSLTV